MMIVESDSVRATISSGDPQIQGFLDEAFVDIAVPGADTVETALHFAIEPDGPSTVSLAENGSLIWDHQRLGTAVRSLTTRLNHHRASGASTPVALHASGFVVGSVGVLAAAPRGTGKTTLVTEMIRRGAGYLSDEVIGVDHDGSFVGYPKPLNIKAGQLERDPGLAASLWPDWRPLAEGDPDKLLPLVTPRRINPDARIEHSAEPGLCLILDRRETISTVVERLAPADLVAALAANAFGFGTSPAAAMLALGHLAARAPGARLVYSDVVDAASALSDQDTWPSPPRPTPAVRSIRPATAPKGGVVMIGIGDDAVVLYVPATRAVHVTTRVAEAVWLAAHEPGVRTDDDVVDVVCDAGMTRPSALAILAFFARTGIVNGTTP